MIRFLSALALLGSASLATAEEATSTPQLTLQLNALQQAQSNCRVSFVAFNGLETLLDKAAFELALFNREGAIDRLVTLDFKQLQRGKTKVLQFELPGLDCANVGRVLINDVSACEGADIVPDTCFLRLQTSTRLDITFGI